jgi:hypothetical protein
MEYTARFATSKPRRIKVFWNYQSYILRIQFDRHVQTNNFRRHRAYHASRNSQISKPPDLQPLSHEFKEHLVIDLNENVYSLCSIIAQHEDCSPADLIIICKGRVISREPTSTLDKIGILDTLKTTGICNLMVLQRPLSPKWLRLRVFFLCTQNQPLNLRMHSASLAVNVKHQIRELLLAPYAVLFLHSADGELLPDDLSLRDLRVPDGGRLYCRIRTQYLASSFAQDEHAAAAAAREQIRQAEAATLSKRPTPGRDSDGPAGRLAASAAGPAPSRRRAAFLGMRRGFLLAGPPAPTMGAAAAQEGNPARAAAAAADCESESAAAGLALASAGEGSGGQPADALPSGSSFVQF